MAKKKSASLGNWFVSLPWIVKLLLAIFLDCVLGIVRLVDGIREGKILKIIIGFLWIFYGLGIGYVLDIIWIILGIRPLFM